MKDMALSKTNIIALFGPSGAGKDAIVRGMMSHPSLEGLVNNIVSTTTRPPREKETQGKDYHFVDAEAFALKLLKGDLIEATEFNGWFYGTEISAIDPDKINLGVFNIEGIECLLDDSRFDVIPIFVDVNCKTRLMRALNREARPDCHEICRRFLQDERDLLSIDFDYIPLDNNDVLSKTLDDFIFILTPLIDKTN